MDSFELGISSIISSISSILRYTESSDNEEVSSLANFTGAFPFNCSLDEVLVALIEAFDGYFCMTTPKGCRSMLESTEQYVIHNIAQMEMALQMIEESEQDMELFGQMCPDVFNAVTFYGIKDVVSHWLITSVENRGTDEQRLALKCQEQ